LADIHLHCLRHGVLTALANGGDLSVASEIAGHSSIAFTHRVYAHMDEARIVRNGEALERALGGAG
jgi:integrase